MERAEVRVTPTIVGDVSPLLFGADVEHLVSQINGGIWDAERDIPRADVQAALRALGVTFLRWPGSIFCSQYRWRDGIGEKEERSRYERTVWTEFAAWLTPRGVDAAEFAAKIGPPEPNLFGTNEFLQYCLDTAAEPLLAANLGGGTPAGEGTPEEAAAWVRYCNVERLAPRPVKWWSVGYEPYAAYELGHCSSGTEYAKRFLEFSAQMRREDPSIKFAGQGVPWTSPSMFESAMEEFDESLQDKVTGADQSTWNEELLRIAGDEIDALAIHCCSFPGVIGRPLRDDEADYLQIATAGDRLAGVIDSVASHADSIVGPARRLPIYLDEWGRQVDTLELFLGTNHRLCDALFFAGCFNRMLERADRVRLATLNFLVNGMGLIQTDGDRHFVTAAYLVMHLYRWSCRRRSAIVEVSCGSLAVPPLPDTEGAPLVKKFAASSRQAPIMDAAATLDDEGASVFLANRALDRDIEVELSGLAVDGRAVFRCLTGSGPFDRNTIDAPGELRFTEWEVKGGRPGVWTVVVPPATAGVVIVGGGGGT